MKIIFLDFDGVMDTEYYDSLLIDNGKPICDSYGIIFDPFCVECLKHIIDKTDARIVVSSSWKVVMTYDEILAMWKDRHLPGIVTGVTPTLSDELCRGDEIDAWIRLNNFDGKYVIMDDFDADNFKEHQLQHLIVVNPYFGIDDLIAERAISILNH
jgi:hypothetical protein